MLRPLLAPGARVALIAPAGPLAGEHELARAIANAKRMGWEPIVAPHALDRTGYFAGSDTQRLDDLNAALRDKHIDGIWCLRGGYGAMRILPGIDYEAARRRPRPLIGYSDITALHAAIGPRAGTVTYHGPTARAELTRFSACSLAEAVTQGGDPCGGGTDVVTWRAGRATGVLTGGNLALLTALAGTPYAPRYEGAILVLEDVHEAVYRIDRMLTTLRLSGALDGIAGLAFGQFTDAEPDAGDGARTLEDLFREVADALKVPVISNVPVGHIDVQWTLPLGATATIDTDAGTLNVHP